MNILYAMLGGFALDWIFGDPAWLTHPVVIMGKAIAALESGLRKRLPKTPRGERLAGLTMAIVLPVGTLLLTGGVCRALAAVHPALGFAAELLWCAQALAATGLAQESRNVYRQLQKDDLPAARQAVGRIVGRDTEALTREGVIRAAVETVAENASDGVIAPLFYMMLGGAPLALTYKAVNTMDSMMGYKNERYLHFGRAAAKLDDAANYLPSRITALLWVAAAAHPCVAVRREDRRPVPWYRKRPVSRGGRAHRDRSRATAARRARDTASVRAARSTARPENRSHACERRPGPARHRTGRRRSPRRDRRTLS